MINVFGFFYCRIKTGNSYLGLLPVRNTKGIIMPNGEWEGWYFSEELKFAQQNGYTIKVLKGYHFDKLDNIFDNYVKHFYRKKLEAKDSIERDVAKRLLNHLLGRFGLHIYKPCTNLVDQNQFNELSQSKNIDSFVNIGDMYLVTYDNTVSKDICDSFNVDYKNTVINNIKMSQETEDTFKDVSIALASAVTSYARIFMAKVKLEVLNRGGKLYYTDTDSLVTDIPLPVKLVGDQIGQFKLQYTIVRGYFISSKTYCIILTDGKPIIKAKGITLLKNKEYTIINNKKVNKLDQSHFIELLNGYKVESFRLESIRNYSEGYVNLMKPHKIELNGDAYTKRTKIFNNDKWIDTKPLEINYITGPSESKQGGPMSTAQHSTDKLDRFMRSTRQTRTQKDKDDDENNNEQSITKI